MTNYNWNFDLDTRPVHTLMSLSGLRKPGKIRCFSEDGSYTEINGPDSIKAEAEWIQKLSTHYERHPDSLFFISVLSGKDAARCKLLDQMLLEKESFTGLKNQLYDLFSKSDLPLTPLFLIEKLESSDTISVYVLLALSLPEGYDEEKVYKGIYPLCEAGGFYLHDAGLYPRSIKAAVEDTRINIHDGILVHETERPWYQKKFEYMGNMQSIGSLFIMILSVLFINELVKLPFGWLLFGALISSGLYLFIRSRRNHP